LGERQGLHSEKVTSIAKSKFSPKRDNYEPLGTNTDLGTDIWEEHQGSFYQLHPIN
jgi:hypothetical protein